MKKDSLKRMLKYVTGGIYIPEALLNSKGDLLMHISDTPLLSYDALKHTIQKLNPKWIIHTGDLVDNLKLELHPDLLDLYKRQLNKLFKFMNAEQVYITLGNHDNKETVEGFNKNHIIVEHENVLEIGRKKFAFSHYYTQIAGIKADVYMFGHDMVPKSTKTLEGRYILNGLQQISIYDVSNEVFYFLKYPIGTDDSRLLRTRIGI